MLVGSSNLRKAGFAGALAALAVGLVALLYLASIHAAIGNSDGASEVLKGQALASGNLTLDHWALSLDSFWLVEGPMYAVAVAIAGVRPQLLHLVPAVAAALVVALGAGIAREGRKGSAGWLASGTVVVLLGLPAAAFAEVSLFGGDHAVTTLWCLIALVALRKLRFGAGFAVAVAFLAAGLLGDLLTVAIGIVPIALAGLVMVIRARRFRAGSVPMVAAISSVLVAGAVHELSKLVGTYTIGPANPRAPIHQMVANLWHAAVYGSEMMGLGYRSMGTSRIPPALQVAHSVGVLLIAGAVVVWTGSILRSIFSRRPRFRGGRPRVFWAPGTVQDPGRDGAFWLDSALTFGFFGSIVEYVVLASVPSPPVARYLVPCVVFGAVLAGRSVGRVVGSIDAPWLLASVLVVALAVTAGDATSFAGTISEPLPYQPATKLVSYLERHSLHRGIGDYWSSSDVTVQSSDEVKVRAVVAIQGTEHLARYMRQSSSTWFRPGFQFLVYDTANPWGNVNAKSAAVSFGPPSQAVAVGPYVVLRWAHLLRVSPDGRFEQQPWMSATY